MQYNVSSPQTSRAAFSLRDAQGRRKYLTRLERRRFRRALKGLNADCRAFCLVLYHTGCRLSEALNLTTLSVEHTEGLLIIETLKQGRSGVFRSISIPKSLLRLLHPLTQKPLGSQLWEMSRSTAYRIVKRVMQAASITGKGACPRGLRHSFGLVCVEAYVPISQIAAWMGHTSLETTVIYLQFYGKEERTLAKRLWALEDG